MGEQVVRRDRAEGLLQPEPRKEVRDRRVEVEATRLHLLNLHDRAERLRDRADLETGLRPDRRPRGRVAEPADHDVEDLLPIRDGEGRPGRVEQRQPVLEERTDALERLGETAHASGKKSLSSRAADSGESLPCTTFSVISEARSPRIVPGGASAGSVGPISSRHRTIAFSPVTLATTTGPPVMNSTSSPKNGFSRCSP